MTIDEAIAHARQVAKNQRKDYDNCKTKLEYGCKDCADYYSKPCKECANEHEQLADWLEELKCYRNDNDFSEYADKLYKKAYDKAYNKAIDDFMDRLLAERTQCYNFDDSEHNNPIKCVWWNDIEGIAEQLVKRRW